MRAPRGLPLGVDDARAPRGDKPAASPSRAAPRASIVSARICRNDRCPCGSGAKYEQADMVFAALARGCALGRAGARNRPGFRKTGTAAVRSVPEDGLEHRSACEAAWPGLAASTAPRLCRACLL